MGDTFNARLLQLRDRICIKRSLAVAKEVRRPLLPQRLPEIPGLEVAGGNLYCDGTGGDYHDFLGLATVDGHTLVVVKVQP